MVARAALALMLLTMLLGGCGLVAEKAPQPTAGPTAMPLTADTVAMVRTAVAAAKVKAPKPDGRDGYTRFARSVYVAAVEPKWSVAATTEVALAQAKAGNVAAREYLTIMVYDIQLLSVMEGVSLSAEDWRAVYVGSGLMSDGVFTGYVALSHGGKVMP